MPDNDLEQMEYIRKWRLQKEHRHRVKAYHWAAIKYHFCELLRWANPWKGGAK